MYLCKTCTRVPNSGLRFFACFLSWTACSTTMTQDTVSVFLDWEFPGMMGGDECRQGSAYGALSLRSPFQTCRRISVIQPGSISFHLRISANNTWRRYLFAITSVIGGKPKAL